MSYQNTLSPRQELFVQEYLADPKLNATKCAIKAGYSEKGAEVRGSQLLRNIKVKSAIKKAMSARMARLGVTQDRVIQELARIAFVDPRKFVDGEGIVKSLSEMDEDTARAISDVDVFTEWEKDRDDKEAIGTRTKIRTFDKRGALEALGRHLGMGDGKSGGENNKGTVIYNVIGATKASTSDSSITVNGFKVEEINGNGNNGTSRSHTS